MTVSKVKYGNIVTYTGTLAEVAQAVSNDQWPESKIHIYYDAGASKVVAWIKTL